MKKSYFFTGLVMTLASYSINAGQMGSGGVSEVYDGGYKSSEGYTIYRIKCNSGGSGSAFQKSNGRWYDSGGSSFSDRYQGWSLSKFANEMCS